MSYLEALTEEIVSNSVLYLEGDVSNLVDTESKREDPLSHLEEPVSRRDDPVSYDDPRESRDDPVPAPEDDSAVDANNTLMI